MSHGAIDDVRKHGEGKKTKKNCIMLEPCRRKLQIIMCQIRQLP